MYHMAVYPSQCSNYKSNMSTINSKVVAYFSMEYAIDQALKIYSGGLGFLAGSHLRSAFQLNKNIIGIGMLWKHGYYDQERDSNGYMTASFKNKKFHFLEDTGIQFTVNIHDKEVHVRAWFLKPETFNTSPLYLLSTDVPENDDISRTITQHLYYHNDSTRVAQSIILGIGGGKLLDLLNIEIDTYHLNEAHGIPLAFYLYNKFQNTEVLKSKLVFTTHTPEQAGNEERDRNLLSSMRFFDTLSPEKITEITGQGGQQFNYTLAALRLARKANAVSKIHGEVVRDMWKNATGICEIIHITNAQNQLYWQDPVLKSALENSNEENILKRKKQLKQALFKIVADQTGKILDPDVLTIVWARRFATYKRADLLLRDLQQFTDLVNCTDQPVQVIWAGKPYPFDDESIAIFHQIQSKTNEFKNVAVLTGYELALSRLLKEGADIWLNTPKHTREASGTSGMSAAMNGTINFSIPDGWIPEFAIHNHNAFVIPVAEQEPENTVIKDQTEMNSMYKILHEQIIPCYYNDKPRWTTLVMNSMREIIADFDSARMVEEYFEKLY